MSTAGSQYPLNWTLPRVLTAPAIEAWVDAVPANARNVTLRLGEWERIAPFADSRLQGALCLLHRKNIQTEVEVPSITLAEQRAYDAFAETDALASKPTFTPTERRLSGDVAGMVIGHLCKFDSSHQHIPSLQRKSLVERQYLYGSGSESALIVPTDIQRREDPRKSALLRVAFFNNRLTKLLEPLGVKSGISPQVSRWFSQLKSFAFEATENTWDHGRLDFDHRPIQSLRFIRLRRIDIGRRGFDIEKVVPGFEEPFMSYLNALSAASNLASIWGKNSGRLVEITVADGGVGIAARMAGKFDVYEGCPEVEKQYVGTALLPEGTSKTSSQPGRGQGFRKMLRACHRLSGLVIIRTGRLKGFRTYRRPDGSQEEYDFSNAPSEAFRLETNETPLPLLAGTSVSLIFPIQPRDRSQIARGE